MSTEQRKLAELFARQQQIMDAAIEELADLLGEGGADLTEWEKQNVNPTLPLRLRAQATWVGEENAVVERIKDVMLEAAERIEFLETQIKNAKSALHLFKQPSIVGTSTARSWTTSQTPGDAQPKNGETK